MKEHNNGKRTRARVCKVVNNEHGHTNAHPKPMRANTCMRDTLVLLVGTIWDAAPVADMGKRRGGAGRGGLGRDGPPRANAG